MPIYEPNKRLQQLINSKKRPTDEELLQAGIPGWKTVNRKKIKSGLLNRHPEFKKALKNVRHQYEASLPGSVSPTHKHNTVLQRIKERHKEKTARQIKPK